MNSNQPFKTKKEFLTHSKFMIENNLPVFVNKEIFKLGFINRVFLKDLVKEKHLKVLFHLEHQEKKYLLTVSPQNPSKQHIRSSFRKMKEFFANA